MLRRIGLFSSRALAKASAPHGYQSTGLCACWRRYGDFSRARRFVCEWVEVEADTLTFGSFGFAGRTRSPAKTAAPTMAKAPAIFQFSDTGYDNRCWKAGKEQRTRISCGLRVAGCCKPVIQRERRDDPQPTVCNQQRAL